MTPRRPYRGPRSGAGRPGRTVVWNGKRRTWSAWAVEMGLEPDRGAAALRKRARLGWPKDKIFTTPVRRWKAVSI